MIRTRSITAAAVALAGFSLAQAARADGSAYVGNWHWNRAASTPAEGEPVPNDVVLSIARADPARMEWTVTVVDDKGERHVESFRGAANGKPFPLEGSPDGTTVAVTLNGDQLETVYTVREGGSDRENCAVSGDRKKMTCRGTESDGQGHTANYVDVYDRQ